MALSSTSFALPALTSIQILLILHFFFFARVSLAFLSTEGLPTTKQQSSPRRFQGSKGQTSELSTWSKIAEYDARSSSFRLIDTDDNSIESMSYNLVSPREWLEYCEARQREAFRDESQQQQQQDKSSGGAYTVLRCDFQLDDESWRIWGNDFHFQRLGESFRSFLSQAGLGVTEDMSENELLALDSSRAAMNLLLEEAKATILINKIEEQKEKSIITVMLTLLWDLDYNRNGRDNDEIPLRVHGHAFSTMKASQPTSTEIVTNPNASVQAVIGHLPPSALESIAASHENFSSFDSLPNRYQNFPRAKLSSWCRKRRPLEEVFKTNGDIGDVILTKPGGESVELLEGLTSNLFVVYPGKILQTAPSEHVLGGYIRQLVLDSAEKCGYKVELGSISIGDARLWEQVFLTSSIRLIIPVHRMLLPGDQGDDDQLLKLETLWELPSNDEETTDDDCHSTPTILDVLYAELLKHTAQ